MQRRRDWVRKKAPVVTDATIEKTGSLEKVEKPLKEALELDIFDKVKSELTLAVAETVAEAARVNGILNIEISKK